MGKVLCVYAFREPWYAEMRQQGAEEKHPEHPEESESK